MTGIVLSVESRRQTVRLTDEQWKRFQRDGYLRLGRLLDNQQLAELQQRIDAIMLGDATIDYDTLLMQLDSDTGAYGDAPRQSNGHKGRTLGYRKIQGLEQDPLFLEYLQRPLFRDICARSYGADTPVGVYRAMFMNKPVKRGTFLPWHQDRWPALDRDPEITIWTALDAATIENGCVQVIPGTHGTLINREHPSGFLTEEMAKEHCEPSRVEYLELEAGEAAILHNWLLHASDVNRSEIARRGFSVCYMDARTKHKNGATYPVVFGEGALQPREVAMA